MSERSGCPAKVLAQVDPTRCEAKGPCLDECPEHAITLRPTSDAIWQQLGPLSRLKNWVHGGKLATIDPDLCAGCGACVPVCPEKAISLRPVG